jgi:hypothetical protein
MRDAGKRRADQQGVANRLQKIDFRQQSLGRMAQHRLAVQHQQLLRRRPAVARSGSGGNENGGYFHAAQM